MHHYRIFETAGGFCGVAWNDVGIARFQLPARSADAAERLLLRRLPDAAPGEPTPMVADAIAAVRRYFAGEETDFSRFELDLGDQQPFFRQIYAAARACRMGPHHDLRHSRPRARGRAGGRARCRPGNGRESGRPDHSVPPGAGRWRQGRRFLCTRRLRRQAAHAEAGGRRSRTAAARPGGSRVLKPVPLRKRTPLRGASGLGKPLFGH